MSKDFSRRQFLGRIALGTAAGAGLPILQNVVDAAPAAVQPLPHRVLGRTGASVSILAFGCGSRFLMYEDEGAALEALNRAIDLGITYLDTAYSYGDGKSETRVGKVMATRRKEVFLATKIPDRTRDGFLRRLEGSLKRLQVDHVDLVHIHSLGRADDLAKLEAADGALHRHDQPYGRPSDGPGDRAARPRLRADGAERFAQRPLRRIGSAGGTEKESGRDRHESGRAGVPTGERPRQRGSTIQVHGCARSGPALGPRRCEHNLLQTFSSVDAVTGVGTLRKLRPTT
jgi:hypothetical protein